MKIQKKIRNKIILSYTVLNVLLLITVSLFFTDLIRETHLDMIKNEIYEKLDFIDLIIHEQPAQPLQGERLLQIYDSISRIINLRLTIVSFQGNVIADTEIKNVNAMEKHRYRAEISQAMLKGKGSSIRYSHTQNAEMLYCAKKSDRFIIRLAKPLIAIDTNLNRLRRLILAAGLFIFFTSFIIIVVLSRKIVKPIEETINFSKQFAEGNYSKRILNYHDDEIGELQKSLNIMADSLVEKITSLMFEQNKLKITLESIGDGIAVIDHNKRILISNKAFSDYFDYQNTSEPRAYFEVIRSGNINAKIKEAIEKSNEYDFEDTISDKVLSVHLKPIKGESALQGILIILHNITETKRIEQIKTELVGNMSHELKTPVTIIKGYLETIQENLHDPDTCRGFIIKAIENADRQNSLINDILKLNELETSHAFIIGRIHLDEIIQNCIELLRPKALNKNIDLEVDLALLTDPVEGNAILAEEIFYNLIDNAISYNNPSGKVYIRAQTEGNGCVVELKDTGIGIPEESIDRIFERFYRVDKSRSRDKGGTGLGLSIVKHAVEILNWKIRVKSGAQGTVFTIEV